MNKSIILHINGILFASVLSMLYYLLPILGISQVVFFVIFISVVLFSYFANESLLKKLGYLEYLILALIFISVVLYVININNYKNPFFNDLIRLFCFFLFLRYLKSLKILERILFFKIFVSYTILFILPVLYMEYNFNIEFKLFMAKLFDSEYNENIINTRLAGLIGDSNALSFLLVILTLIFTDTNYKLFIKIIVIFFMITAIFYSGSRMGLLMVILLFLRYFGFFRSILFFSFFSILFFFLVGHLDFRDASDSDNDRMDSIISAWNYLISSDFIIPLGNILYKNNYLNLSSANHYPHLGFLYLFTEYGLFFVPIFVLLFFLFRRVFYSDLYLFFILLLAIFLLPNQIYYFTFYLALIYNNEKSSLRAY